MKRRTIAIILILASSLFFLGFGVYYFGHLLSRAYAPPKITVTKDEISSSVGFVNPVTIEKLKVDSFGKDKRPVKYIIEYRTTCTIKQNDREIPVALKEIKLNKPGSYSWIEEKVDISMFHPDGFSRRIDPGHNLISSKDRQEFSICPLRLERDNWYFIDFGDPVFIGVYVVVDGADIIHQYAAYSERLPI